MVKYTPPVVDFKRKARKSKTIPDQAISLREIVKRYVRGIPVDVKHRDPLYVDQSDDDLERLSRLDFGEKAEYAQALAERAAEMQNELAESKRRATEAKEAKANEAKAAGEAKAAEKPQA